MNGGDGEVAANEENGDAEAEEESEGFRGDVGGDEEWEILFKILQKIITDSVKSISLF